MLSSTPIVDNTIPVPSDIHQVHESDSINSDITKHAEDITNNLDSALTQLHNDNNIIDPSSNMTATVQCLVQSEIQVLNLNLTRKEALLDHKLHELKALHSSCQQLETNLLAHSTQLQTKIDFFDTKTKEWTDTFEKFLHTTNNDITVRFQELENRVNALDNHVKDISNHATIQAKIDDLSTQLTSTHSHTKNRLHQLKTTTKAMFQQNDNDNEILSDRIFRLESGLAKMKQKFSPTPAKTKLTFESTSDSASHSSTSPPVNITSSGTKQASTTTTPRTPNLPYPRPASSPIQSHQPSFSCTYTSNPDMDYLRKNLHLSCSKTNQILEFYIKLRLAISKGGIYLKPIEKITKDDTIADVQHNTTNVDVQNQSNALYTLLANEKYIPATFTLAQNCILGYSTTMDGFAALKAMLKLIHPVLNKKRPSNIPPVLSEATNIHNYEQNLRNFYLLHKLYSKTEYSVLDQSKQLLLGMDDAQYSDSVKRIQHQLDTTEIMKFLFLMILH